MIRRLTSLCALLPLILALGACTTDSDESVEPATSPEAGTGFVATYKPDVALMPFPTDVWRSGSADGTLNIYAGGFESDPLNAQIQQMNLLDGFGLNSQIWADFSDPISEDSLVLGQTVFVFNVTNPSAPAPVTSFELGTAGFQGGRAVLELNPTAPLDPLNTYAVILTSNIQSTGGDPASPDDAFQAMLDAYPNATADTGSDTSDAVYAQMVKPLLDLAEGVGVGADNVVAAWSFTTQSVGDSLGILQATATAQTNAIVPLGMDTSQLNPALAGLADVYVGAIEMPYYLDPEDPLTSYWQPVEASCQTAIGAELISEASASTTAFCPQPAVQGTVSVPVLVTVPNANAQAATGGACTADAPTGVTVFQHGITQDRTNALAVADTLAQGCQAVIAIDLPLHGITDTTSGLYAIAGNPAYDALEGLSAGITDALTEQTFNLDLINNETGAEGADEVIDPSGEYFINLESPITARDALRQGAANLIHLVATIPDMDYDVGNGVADGPDFTGLPVGFVGHSLGGITGTVFLGVNTDVGAAVLNAPGGDIADLILGSASIYPEVEAGLAENGLTPGMRFFSEFFRNAQTLIEGGDPVNYAAAANANHNILMQQIVGGSGADPDLVVPNTATQRLADVMGLPARGPGNYTDAAGVDGLVQFLAGDHSSLLSPSASAAATSEMQTEMVGFVGSGGLQLPVGSVDPSIIVSP